MRHRLNNNVIYWLAFLMTLVFSLGLRHLLPERDIHTLGWRAIGDALFVIVLAAWVLLTAYAIGRRALQVIVYTGFTQLEILLISMTVGLGAVSLGMTLLAVFNILFGWSIALLLILAGFIGRNYVAAAMGNMPHVPGIFISYWGSSRLGHRILIIAVVLLGLLSFCLALTPPWDADGLIYHLKIPSLMLEAGGLIKIDNFWESNYPLGVEMLFVIGMVFGSDTFPKVMHLIFGFLLVIGIWSGSQRFLTSSRNWLAPVLFLGIPILPLWASSAYIDLAWVLYEYLAVYLVLLWRENNQNSLLFLIGLFCGYAIASKYLGLVCLGLLGLFVIVESRKKKTRSWVVLVVFGSAVAVGGSFWYIKNLVLYGNPFYPLEILGSFPGVGGDNLWMKYMNAGFGTGRSLRDYLLTPINLFVQRQRFATFGGTIEIPNPLFLLAIVYPLTRKTKILNLIALYTLLRYLAWLAGVQQTRLLLPLFPWIALLTSWGMCILCENPILQRLGRILIPGLAGGMLVATIIYAGLINIKVQPWRIISGMENKESLLLRMVDNYAAMRYIQGNLPSDSRVMMLWDGRGYYCDKRCLPDYDHSQWTRMVLESKDSEYLARKLQLMGITHLMFSASDLDFILQHDPGGEHLIAAKVFMDEFRTIYTEMLYTDDWCVIYNLLSSSLW